MTTMAFDDIQRLSTPDVGVVGRVLFVSVPLVLLAIIGTYNLLFFPLFVELVEKSVSKADAWSISMTAGREASRVVSSEVLPDTVNTIAKRIASKFNFLIFVIIIVTFA